MKKFAKNHHFTNNVLLPTDVLNNYLRTCDPLLTIPLKLRGTISIYDLVVT